MLGFKNHVETATAKEQTTSLVLVRLIPDVRGSRYRKRKLLSTIVVRKLLYESSIWAKSLVFNWNVVVGRKER